MTRRYEYYLDLSEPRQLPSLKTDSELHIRAANQTDFEALAELMLDAYRGTIDYEGETLQEAVSEVQGYLAGQQGGKALLQESRLCFADNSLVAACLVGEWDERQQPLITYVMTGAAWKKRGFGKKVLGAALEALRGQGYGEVWAVITEGNGPSEHLFMSMGFEKVE
jgi:L-amino acid N-acyltransferase YncA